MVELFKVLEKIRLELRYKCVVSAAVSSFEPGLVISATTGPRMYRTLLKPEEVVLVNQDKLVAVFVKKAKKEFKRK